MTTATDKPEYGEFIFTTQVFRKIPDGTEIHHHKVVYGVAPLDFNRWTAPITVPVGQDMRGRPIFAKGEVPVPGATTIEEAFEKLPDILTVAAKEIQTAAHRELTKPKILTPGKELPKDLKLDGQRFKFHPGE